MKDQLTAGFAGLVTRLPAVVLDVTAEGVIAWANTRTEALFGRPPAGESLFAHLDRPSIVKLKRLLSEESGAGPAPAVCELNLELGGDIETRRFAVVRGDGSGGRLWLVEEPSDPHLAKLHDELTSTNADLVGAQRELTKKTVRLTQALDEIERKLAENETLSRQLRERNEEVEAQNGELLAMTEELHHGQDELLQLNQQLERRTRELQIALSGRSRFYAAMSHELRTPVNAVMGYNDLLLAGVYGELSEQQEIAVERSQKAVRHLRELINDVLDLSRIESGRIQVEIHDVDVPQLLADIVDMVRPLAAAQGAEVHLVASGECPSIIRSDARRLRQIVLNLLSSAIRGGEGAPVWVRCFPSMAGGIEVEVVDNGPGMAPDELATIFDEFGQGSPVQEQSGTGLGLSIARRLAHLLGGRLNASSTLGAGTTFRLTLPKTPPTA